jgi:hypothetical protein
LFSSFPSCNFRMQQIPSRRWHGFLLTRWDAEKVSRNRGLDSDYFEKKPAKPVDSFR